MEEKNKCYSYYKKIRGDWNGVNPVTRIERDRTKYTRKVKHKKKYEE